MYKPFDLTGKVVAVVGANEGIGYGMAEALVQAGATVVIGGRRHKNNVKAAKQLGADYIDVDATNEESVVNYMNEVVNRYNRLDACFAVAGGPALSPPFDISPLDYWQSEINNNLTSVYLCFREASNHMIRLGNGGSLVSISSVCAVTASASVNAYSAAKAGLVGLTNSLCKKLGDHNIRINTIMAGVVDTPATRDLIPEDYKANLVQKSVFKKIGQPEDFGGLAIYLTSDASHWHTADTFLLDGGQTKT